jgi:CheY-like chemotaxis protein
MSDPIEKKEVLIVEDDMIISMVLEQMVEKLGLHVIDKTTRSQKAIELVLELSPDIVLMDVQLKDDMDGISTMQEIRKSSAVPVIYVTGNSDPYYRSRAKKTNYVDYLVKPIQVDDLKASIRKAFPN